MTDLHLVHPAPAGSVGHHHATPPVVPAEGWPAAPADWILDEAGLDQARATPLPELVRRALADLDHAAAGAVILRGVPVGTLPPTPTSPTEPTTKDHASEFALMTVATALGEPVGYAPEHGGDLIQNIVPTRTASSRQVSTSSKVELMFHTEAAFHPHRPRFLLLLCLRGDESALTTLASSHELRRVLAPEVVEILRQPRFRTAVDESYLHGRTNELGAPMAVLTDERMIFDADLMVGVDPDADEALLALSDAVERCHTAVALRQGDLLVVDNHAAIHGRSPYQPRFDGTDRWLQRTFVVSDLAPSAGDRRGRVITTQFGREPDRLIG